MESKTFHSPYLIPLDWLEDAVRGEARVFNPAILRVNGDLVMAYRVVFSDGRRRVALCRLDGHWSVIPGSPVAFSDAVRYADVSGVDIARDDWIADPRLVLLGGRFYLHFNRGECSEPNRIYLIEIDPICLLPAGLARQVTRMGGRCPIEKNWQFFEQAGKAYVIYSFSPLEILIADLSDPHEVRCTPIYSHTWDDFAYSLAYGELRGGATPVHHDGQLWVVVHSVFSNDKQPGAKGESMQSLIYVGALIVLDGVPPFAPRLISPQPILEALPFEQTLHQHPLLDYRCESVVYPSGAIIEDGKLIVSYGLNNKCCALRQIPFAAIYACLVPTIMRSASNHFAQAWLAKEPPKANGDDELGYDLQIRAYWWNPMGESPRSPNRTAQLAQGRFVHGNFGDLFVPHMLGRITGLSSINTNDNPRLFTIGSLIQIAKEGDVIWGSGLKGDCAHLRYAPRNLHVFATRGPISLEFLRRAGFDTSRVTCTFDPASLAPYLLRDEITGMQERIGDPLKDFLLIPHFLDYALMCRHYAGFAEHICSPDTPVLELLEKILCSNLVVSSSLHGLIFAEALGIPAVWHRPLMGEDELKFTDYYLGTGRYRVVRVETLQDAFRVSPMPLPSFDYHAMLATFPSATELEEFGVLRRTEALEVGCWTSDFNAQSDAIRFRYGWSDPEPHGVWSDGKRAELDICIENTQHGELELEIRFSCYVPNPEHPGRIEITDAWHPLWSITLVEDKQYQLQVPVRQLHRTGRWVRLVFLIDNPACPFELALGTDLRRLGVLLHSLRVRPELPADC